MSLAEINDEEENNVVADILAKTKRRGVFIGLDSFKSPGESKEMTWRQSGEKHVSGGHFSCWMQGWWFLYIGTYVS